MWSAADEGGLDAAVKLTEPDVEWVPHQAGGRVLRSDEVLELFETLQRDSELAAATLYSIERHGDFILASGSFRLREGNSLSEFQVHWVYTFRDGALIRAASYAARVDAFRALGLE